MTLAVQAGRDDFIGNSVAVDFTFTFRILTSSGISVFLDGVAQTLATHFTLSGVGDASGGTVTFITAPGNNVAVLLLRNQALEQLSNYQPNEDHPAERIESDFDDLTMQVQMLQEEVGRCIKLPKKSLQSDKDVDDLVADKFLKVKAAAAGVQMADLAAAGAITIPVTVAEGGTGATTAAAARDTLLADEDARTNTVKVVATKKATTTGTPAAGIGVGDKWQAESADENPSDFGQIEFAATDVTAASEDTYMQTLLRVAGAALVSCYRWAATGAFNAIFTHANTAARTFTLPDKDGIFAMTNDVTVLRGYLSGLGMTNNAVDADHDIDFAVGVAVDDAFATLMSQVTSPLIKQIDNGWVVGTNQGGLDTGAVAADLWYHTWLIRRSDTGVVDCLFSLSATAPTLPTNYDEKRRIGAVLTDGSSNIIAFKQNGDEFKWDVPVQDQSGTNPGVAPVTETVTVPLGVVVHAICAFHASDPSPAASTFLFVSSLDQTATAPSAANSHLQLIGASAAVVAVDSTFAIKTDISQQFRTEWSVSDADLTFEIVTHGWIDRRGRDA